MLIKELREKKGMTQRDLALKLNVVQTTVAMWESGNNAPRAVMLPKLAEVLGCNINDLFEGKENT